MSCKNIRDTVILVDNINLFVLKLKYIQSNYKKWNVSQLRNQVIANKVYLLKNVRGCYKISVLLMYDSIALLYYFSSFWFFLFCNVKKINDSLLKKKNHKIELIDKNLSQWSENIQEAKEKLF